MPFSLQFSLLVQRCGGGCDSFTAHGKGPSSFFFAAAVFACLLLLAVRVSCSDDVAQGLLRVCSCRETFCPSPLSFFVVFFCSNGTRPQQKSRGQQHTSPVFPNRTALAAPSTSRLSVRQENPERVSSQEFSIRFFVASRLPSGIGSASACLCVRVCVRVRPLRAFCGSLSYSEPFSFSRFSSLSNFLRNQFVASV